MAAVTTPRTGTGPVGGTGAGVGKGVGPVPMGETGPVAGARPALRAWAEPLDINEKSKFAVDCGVGSCGQGG